MKASNIIRLSKHKKHKRYNKKTNSVLLYVVTSYDSILSQPNTNPNSFFDLLLKDENAYIFSSEEECVDYIFNIEFDKFKSHFFSWCPLHGYTEINESNFDIDNINSQQIKALNEYTHNNYAEDYMLNYSIIPINLYVQYIPVIINLLKDTRNFLTSYEMQVTNDSK